MSAETRSADQELSAGQVKSCCAALYSSEGARLLVGDSLHPGGLQLTSRLAELLHVGPSSRVLDLACGNGTSAIHLAGVLGCEVVGVDLSAANVAAGAERAAAIGVGDRCTFLVGDAERVTCAVEGFDAVICECALCTFPDKLAAAHEMVRLVRIGGRVGISDLTRRGPLHPELANLLGRIACVADALPVADYAAVLDGAGLEVEHVEPHDSALGDLVEAVRQRLDAANLLIALGKLKLRGADLVQAQVLARRALEEVRDGRLGYAIVTAVRPLTPRDAVGTVGGAPGHEPSPPLPMKR